MGLLAAVRVGPYPILLTADEPGPYLQLIAKLGILKVEKKAVGFESKCQGVLQALSCYHKIR
jgi:hypothetical protein